MDKKVDAVAVVVFVGGDGDDNSGGGGYGGLQLQGYVVEQGVKGLDWIRKREG